jgi:hypothetical protein
MEQHHDSAAGRSRRRWVACRARERAGRANAQVLVLDDLLVRRPAPLDQPAGIPRIEGAIRR